MSIEHSLDLAGLHFSRFTRLVNGNLEVILLAERIAELVEDPLALFSANPQDPKSEVGRGSAVFRRVAGEQVVLRHSRRGGFISKLVSDKYFQFVIAPAPAITRQWQELRALCILRAANISVPEPLGAQMVWKGRYWYSGAIMTQRLNGENFLSLIDPQKPNANLEEIANKAGLLAGKCLNAGILHRDLHIGNVFVSPTQETHLLDFDRAKLISRDSSKLAGTDLLKRRWRRSCEKHDSRFLIEPFELGISGSIAPCGF